VFVSTAETPPGAPPMTRLLMAQDAGGAIRGPVRVDFFFGSGPQAQVQASKTRQPAQMWVLLPNGLKIAAKESRVRVRGAAVAPTLDCVVNDPDLCVESGQ
jgi:membrane-bound lytic murein transglycosylase A